MSSVIPVLGREVTFTALGRTWKTGRMDIEVLDKFIDWARPQIPDPFAHLTELVPSLQPDAALTLIREAREKAEQFLDYDSPMVKRLLKTKRGIVHVFLFMLQVHQPHATLADAEEISRELGQEKMEEIFSAAAGRMPEEGKADAPAPSAAA